MVLFPLLASSVLQFPNAIHRRRSIVTIVSFFLPNTHCISNEVSRDLDNSSEIHQPSLYPTRCYQPRGGDGELILSNRGARPALPLFLLPRYLPSLICCDRPFPALTTYKLEDFLEQVVGQINFHIVLAACSRVSAF